MISYRDDVPSPALLHLQRLEKQLAARYFDFCERHGLTSFLVCGSALGAVRHGDVIPWDDDIDVGMLRADFERLFAAYAADPIPGTYLQSHRNEPGYPYPFAKLRLDGTHVVEPAFASGMGHDGIFIDIFPFDRLPASAAARTLQSFGLGLLNLFIMPLSAGGLAATPSPTMRRVKRLAAVVRGVVPRGWLIGAREWLAQRGNDGPGRILDSFGMYGIRFGPETPVAPELLLPPVKARFGEIEVWLPAQTEAYLAGLFGDWRRLPPPDQRRPGHVTAADFGVHADSDTLARGSTEA